MKAYNVRIYGLVQGVGFRHATKLKARELGLIGYVENMDDGSVHIVAQGTAFEMESFLSWCEDGPVTAHVETMEFEEIEPIEAESFEIKRN